MKIEFFRICENLIKFTGCLELWRLIVGFFWGFFLYKWNIFLGLVWDGLIFGDIGYYRGFCFVIVIDYFVYVVDKVC